MWNCPRQSGKSFMDAVRAVHQASLWSNSLVLIVSASLRQAGETFRKVLDVYHGLRTPIKRTDDSSSQMTLANGSRIITLPGKEGTIRGYSAPSLIIVDEAAQCPDSLYYALRPMLATSRGTLILSSSPFAKLGFFWEIWRKRTDLVDWWTIMVTADECPRIDPAILAADKRAMSRQVFEREYYGKFMPVQGGLFTEEDIESMRMRVASDFNIAAWHLPAIENEGGAAEWRRTQVAEGLGVAWGAR
ncbi:MAG TPA: terminase family protein [Anaerolineae bacterium]|nr:terminase family protein [Anaerolineae bacterium]